MNKHTCIKPGCGTPYEDEEVDAYYCPQCDTKRKALAAEIDSKFPRNTEKAPSALEAYDASPKIRGFAIAKL